jgi:hypothetical protein
LERINKKIHYFLENLLVLLQTILQDAQFSHQDKFRNSLKIQFSENFQPKLAPREYEAAVTGGS